MVFEHECAGEADFGEADTCRPTFFAGAISAHGIRCARFLLVSKSSIDNTGNGGSIGFDQGVGFGGRMTVGGKAGRREIITGIVTRLPLKLTLVGELGEDQDLSSLGLKSFDLVRLMLAVEDAFDLEIPPHLITAESFGSVGAIERLIDSLVD